MLVVDTIVTEKDFKSCTCEHSIGYSVLNLDDDAVKRVILCAACCIGGNGV